MQYNIPRCLHVQRKKILGLYQQKAAEHSINGNALNK